MAVARAEAGGVTILTARQREGRTATWPEEQDQAFSVDSNQWDLGGQFHKT